MLFLEINDWQLTAWDESGERLLMHSAGASTAPGELSFGAVALAHSRSHPQQFNNRYLYSLAADPISGDLRPAKNHADLIYHHFLQLSLPAQPVALLVGGQLTNQQLGLLLGICQEAKISIAGFIDAALAQSYAVPASGDYHVLDVELHRMTLSHIAVAETQRQCAQTVTLDGLGVANIIDGWMNVIADAFVQKTRFDPLHTGHTEQQLYDQVSRWITEIGIVDRRVSVTNGEASRDIEVAAGALKEKLRQRLAGMELDHVQRLILSPRAASIAGLQALLAERINYIDVAQTSDLVPSALQLAQGFSPTETRRIVSAAIAASSTEPRTATDAGPATHLLCNHVAYAIGDARFNGHLEHTPALGEQLNIAGDTYTAIRLE